MSIPISPRWDSTIESIASGGEDETFEEEEEEEEEEKADRIRTKKPKKSDSSLNESLNGSVHSSTYGTGSYSDEDDRFFAKRETKRVKRLKVFVLIILALVTIAVCLSVFFLIKRGQEAELERAYEGSADKVLASFQDILEQKIAAIAALGVTFTAFAKAENSTWPFVTMNDFQQRAASAKSLSSAYFLELLPIVTDANREKWEEYSVENKDWLVDGRIYQDRFDLGASRNLQEQSSNQKQRGQETVHQQDENARRLDVDEGDQLTGDVVLTFTEGNSSISEKIFRFSETFALESDPGPGPYYPIWQSSPVLPEPRDLVNYNLVTYGGYGPYIELAANTGQIAIGGLDVVAEGGITHPDLTTSFFAYILSFTAGRYVNYTGDPMSSVYIPVVDSFDDDRQTVAVLVAIINWATYFEDILPINNQPVIAVLENSCDGPHSYKVSGSGVEYLGAGNLSNEKFHWMKEDIVLDSNFVAEATTISLTLNQDLCQYKLTVYPSDEMDAYYNTSFPVLITCVIAAVFLFTVGVFLMYDAMVEFRQKKVLDTAQRSTAIVTSIFPKTVVGRLMKEPVQGNATKLRHLIKNNEARSTLFSKQDSTEKEQAYTSSEPIADLFPSATVMFADVEGFTAWSSVREPSQVFTLLETLYRAFDLVAKRRSVFKVETVGDCYVAVAGLPEPREDHAVVMARFARDCVEEHLHLTKELEVSLGPDTADLRLRVGLHSGPITAGVLRGDRSRFQLFGDTVNVASRMENASDGNRIHVSPETAKLLAEFNKGHWVVPRNDSVHLKGKGELQTFWLEGNLSSNGSSQLTLDVSNKEERNNLRKPSVNSALGSKTGRLVEWNIEILLVLIKQSVARRRALAGTNSIPLASTEELEWKGSDGANPLEEVVEIIHLPEIYHGDDAVEIELNPAVVAQVRDYVTMISQLYKSNPFHNFEHASHVAMSVGKLLRRIVAPSDMDFLDQEQARTKLHDHTYGITSDPLTQFACVLSALIHDADHPGIPNLQMIKENDPLAEVYGNKSVAEQHSVEIAWDLLMEPKYKDLRATICADSKDLSRLRQLVVNSVMATDIMDKDLKQLRNARWEKAFSEDFKESEHDRINRKATIVIEHLIQASDVAHTMQHWNVYRKWNARLFREMYKAFKEGRSETDPSTNWYKGEIGFFDFYIIPLAKKLKDCGVFGVSSDEYLQYAINNRNEWEQKGEAIVAELIASVQD